MGPVHVNTGSIWRAVRTWVYNLAGQMCEQPMGHVGRFIAPESCRTEGDVLADLLNTSPNPLRPWTSLPIHILQLCRYTLTRSAPNSAKVTSLTLLWALARRNHSLALAQGQGQLWGHWPGQGSRAAYTVSNPSHWHLHTSPPRMATWKDPTSCRGQRAGDSQSELFEAFNELVPAAATENVS